MLQLKTTSLLFALTLWAGLLLGGGVGAQVQVVQVARGFDVPWSLAFLPDGAILVTERGGVLWRVAPDGARSRVEGVPRVRVQGQGGLLDVAVARDFANSRRVYLSYVTDQPGGSGTALAHARLSPDGTRLTEVTQIFQMTPGSRGGRHFGGRIVEAPDGALFLTIGDRGDSELAQNLQRHNGSVIRIRPDGGVPPGNPLADSPGALPEIWSYGHRNPQGAALDLQGRLWITEHGARGGDEANLIRKGANYGWPVIAYGRHYSGAKIGEGTAKPGMEQPVLYWDPSIAPSGLAFYDGNLFPHWRGHAFAGSLKFDYIARLSGTPLHESERIQTPETRRVRDIRTGPDGAIWFLSEDRGALYRIIPAD
ncbi:PQQ-dependent sugar dehydrogenase [Thalassovita sp.]|uniref:PQQ-dependent sugar dehydrogenase n=1 Tax=Thalassovita sp. TaxID=1979401 RepID=UPI0029DE5403|nr:PQQ-dependent sugar dehydrogenase [Thalassovita sp.]